MNMALLQITSLVYIILLVFVYFSKKRLNSLENRIYKKLIILNVFGLILDMSCLLTCLYFEKVAFLCSLCCRSLLVYYVGFIMMYTYYVVAINSSDKRNADVNKLEKSLSKSKFICSIIFFIASLLVILLPMEYHIDKQYAYTYGVAIDFLTVFMIIVMTYWGYLLIKNFKKIKEKKYLPVILFIVLAGIAGVVQRSFPQLLITTPIETFIVFLMYFTIENPDLQIVDEYHSIKELNTKRNIDKEQEIYNLRQRVRFPVMEIEERSKYLIEKMDNKEFKDEIREIENLSKSTLLAINNLMKVDKMDNYYLKKVNDKYDPRLLFEQALRAGKIVHDIKYSYHIDSNIPDYLLGDGLHLKNVLKKLLEISLSKTTEGMVHVNITTIIKNDICRLFIELTDTSKGYSNKELESIYKTDGVYFEIKQILDNIGGSIVVNSEKGTGNDIIITIDQKVFDESNTKLEKLNKEYQKERVLVVTQDKKAIKDIEAILKKSEYDYEFVNLGVECLRKIRNHDQYSLIILDSNTEPLNGMEIYNKLLEVKDFNIDVIMMTDNASFKLKNYYLENGIRDIISLPIDKKQALVVINNIKNR